MFESTRVHGILTALKYEIHIGKYATGERLPSERELADIYNVSRDTVRKALQTLELSGEIERIGGAGTFVSSRREPRLPASDLTDGRYSSGSDHSRLSSMMYLTGHRKADWFQRPIEPTSLVAADEDLAKYLYVQPQTFVLRKQILVTNYDGRTLAVQDSYFPVSAFGTLALGELTSELEEKIRESVAARQRKLKEALTIRLPNEREHRLLHISRLMFVAELEWRVYDQGSHLLELSTITARSSDVRFYTEYAVSEG